MTLKMSEGVHRQRLRSEGIDSGGLGGGCTVFAREKGVIIVPRPKIGDRPPTGFASFSKNKADNDISTLFKCGIIPSVTL